MAQRIWFVSELYYPEETSTGYFVTKIAEGLAEFFTVGVLCSQPTYSDRGTRAPKREVHNGVNIERCFGSTFNKDTLPLRLINFATISFSILFTALLRFARGDDVIVVTNPPTLPFLMALVCKLRRARCILLVHDVYPEMMVACGMTAPGSLLARVIEAANKIVYRAAERIVVLGRDMQALVNRKLDVDFDRVIVIPNWGDVDFIVPGRRMANPLLNRLGVADKFLIQYSGNMGRNHGIEDLLAAAALMRDEPEYHFLFIGWGAKKKWLEQETANRHLSNVTLLPNQPRQQLSDSLNACDIAAIAFVAGMAGVSVPSRMYNVLAAGKPILAVADPDAELSLVVTEERAGWVASPGNPERIVEIIRDARANPEMLAEMGTRARRAAETKYSLGHVLALYRLMLSQIPEAPVHADGSSL